MCFKFFTEIGKQKPVKFAGKKSCTMPSILLHLKRRFTQSTFIISAMFFLGPFFFKLEENACIHIVVAIVFIFCLFLHPCFHLRPMVHLHMREGIFTPHFFIAFIFLKLCTIICIPFLRSPFFEASLFLAERESRKFRHGAGWARRSIRRSPIRCC